MHTFLAGEGVVSARSELFANAIFKKNFEARGGASRSKHFTPGELIWPCASLQSVKNTLYFPTQGVQTERALLFGRW